MDGFEEYVTFTTTDKDGNEIEMAVVDEFEYEDVNYVVGALIEGDTVNEDGLYIYKAIIKGEDFQTEKINNPDEYEKIADAYMAMDTEI